MSKDYRIYPPLAMDEVMDTFIAHNTPPRGVNQRALEPINFGKGISTFNPFDYVENVETQLTGSELRDQTYYGEINGLMSFREAICCYYADKFNCHLSSEQICITHGASEALVIAFAMLVKSGGEIILPESCFPAYKVLAKMFSAQCRFAPLNNNLSLDVEQLPKFITPKTQAILVNSPSNPHGAVLNAQELAAIADLGVPIIFDEVYQPLSLTKKAAPSAISHCDQHLLVNSFSKSLAIAGFRVGYLIVPKAQAQLMTNVKAVMSICTSLPSQAVGEILLEHWDELVEKHRQMLTKNWHIFNHEANELGLKLLSQPKAGFFALVDISETGRNSMDVALDLAKYYALSSVPGIDFQPVNTGFLRINFACPTEQIKPGLRRLAAYIEKPYTFD